MKDRVFSAVQRLVRKQRRRLWFTHLLAQAYLPLGWTALVFIGGGIFHQGIMQVNRFPLLLFACTPPLLYMLLQTIRQMPSLTEGATQADIQLQAHSLFINVWEMATAQHIDSGTQSLLIARAERQLPQWRKQMDAQVYPRPGTSLLLALSITALGGFLLLLPGKLAPLPNAGPPLKTNQHQPTTSLDPVAEINEALLMESRETPGKQAAVSMAMSPETRLDERHDDPDTTASAAPDGQKPDELKPAFKTTQDESHQQMAFDRDGFNMQRDSRPSERRNTGRAPGMDSPNPTTPDSMQAASFRQQRRQEIEIPGQPDTRAFNQQVGSQLATGGRAATPDDPTSPYRPAAGGIGSQLSFSRMSAGQRVLVLRYFKQLSQFYATQP